jgi:hypothetical protein
VEVVMKYYWNHIHLESEGPHYPGRIQAMTARPLKDGEHIILYETLGYIERVKDGSWVCYAKIAKGYMEYVGYEPNANHAKNRVRMRHEYELQKLSA